MAPRSKTPWEADFWKIELQFAERDVYVIGGGPSIAQCDLSVLADESVIAVNSSYKAVIDAGIEGGVLYFTDTGWWNSHRDDLIERWLPREIVTMSRTAKREQPVLVRRIQHAVPSASFPENVYGSSVVKHGNSSGHTAVALAVAMGAKRVILLGFDMRLVDGKSHFHTDYGDAISPGVIEGWIEGFNGWNMAANDIGVSIVNATPGSALDEFDMLNFHGYAPVVEEPPAPIEPITTKDFPVEPQRMSFTGGFSLWRHRK